MIKKAEKEYSDEEIFKILTPEIANWFKEKFKKFTPPQKYAVKEIHDGRNILISSPTGSGKTLSAFLSAINELLLLAKSGLLEDKIYVLYVSPLKALNNDIERNLNKPLKEIYENNKIKNKIRVGVRTGDTSQQERQKQTKKPPHIFITTPESLSIIINAPKFSKKLKEVKWIIVDEIHSLADNKRGLHLSLSLERLTFGMKKKPIRIGLSATISPMKEVANFLVGYGNEKENDCLIVDVSFIKRTDLKVVSPVDDLIYTSGKETSDALYNLLDKFISNHHTTLIFTNTRSATERVVFQLKHRFPNKYEGKIEAHHGSLSKGIRIDVEEKLKNGELKCVVCSTSLELGIDIGYIDLVVLLGSPKSISRALQRVGRSGHFLHEVSKGRIIVLDRDDLVECVVLTKNAKKEMLDRINIPKNALDVLAQHIVGMGIERKWRVEEALKLIRNAYPYHKLKKKDFITLLNYLSGGHEELEDKKVYGKIWFDENEGTFGRRGKLARPIYYLNIGTIPDEVSIKVYSHRKYVGRIEEEFLERLKKGDIFVLAGRTYEFLYTRGMKVFVEPRPESQPTIPAWFSEQLPLSYDLATEIRKFRGKMKEMLKNSKDEILKFLMKEYYMDIKTSMALYNYFKEQEHFLIPTNEELVIEEFIDDNGWINYCFHTLVGRHANDALSRAFAYKITKLKKFNVRITVGDNGFLISYPKWYGKEISNEELENLFQSKDLEKVLRNALNNTEMLKRRFRHVASRSFLILKNYLGHEMSVSRQQKNASVLFKVVKKIDPEFPALKETYREIMEDSMDIENAKKFLRMVEDGDMKIKILKGELPSPFSFNLIAIGASDVVLMEDRKKLIEQMHCRLMERIG